MLDPSVPLASTLAAKYGKLAIKLQIGEKRVGQARSAFLGAGNQRCFGCKFRFLNQLYSPKPPRR